MFTWKSPSALAAPDAYSIVTSTGSYWSIGNSWLVIFGVGSTNVVVPTLTLILIPWQALATILALVPSAATHAMFVFASLAFLNVTLFKKALYFPALWAKNLYVADCPGSVNPTFIPEIVGAVALLIVASWAVTPAVDVAVTVPSVSVVSLLEKFTSKSDAFGLTVASDLMVKSFENAAKPTESPNTATHKATIAITFVLRSLSFFSSFHLLLTIDFKISLYSTLIKHLSF